MQMEAKRLGRSSRASQLELRLAERRRKVEGLPAVSSADEKEEAKPEASGVRDLLTSVEGFRSCLCPRCLHSMPLRRTRPRASVYTGGVRCDYCKQELLGEEESQEADAQDAFCHCSRCWFDLCRHCAYKEMREVWWGEE